MAKVVGPLHKSDVGGVALNIRSEQHLALEFDRMMKIEGAHSVMVQKMLRGKELFIGAKYETRFGHVVLCGKPRKNFSAFWTAVRQTFGR